MNKLLMVQMIGSFFGYQLSRSMILCRLLMKSCCGLPAERERLQLRSIGRLWRHSIELDGVYRLHIDLAPDGVFELFWRHHSGVETPSEVFTSLWQVAITALPQIERYMAFSQSREWTTA
jgi:hypothetical protein